MSMGADLDESTLTIALDIRNPFAYLALAPAIELTQDLGTAVSWLPFDSEPLRPPSLPGADDDRGVRHRRHRARMIAREISVYAEARGLTVEQPYRNAPADAVNLAWLWMRAHPREGLESFLAEAFRRYWALELDASDLSAAAQLVSAHGEDAASFLEWADSDGPRALERVASALAAVGVRGVPSYLVCDQLFLGRQHLPMIRWLLEDGQGPVPI